MNPWREVVDRIEDGTLDELVTFLHSLNDLGRRAVAAHLPSYVAEVRREGMEGRWWLQDRAPRLRAAGAACLSGAAQVADWLDRQDLRQVRDPRTDAARIVSLLSPRTDEWRADLAVRLVEGLRPVRRRGFDERVPNWELAAALVEATGVEPPGNDAFAEGWAWRLAMAVWMTQDVPPLLDVVAPRLFEAAGVAAALNWSEARNHGVSAAARLAGMAADGLVKRETMVDGCAGRFMAGGAPEEVAPFVTLWSCLAVDVTEIPVLDFVRLLPSASPALAGLLAGELRRADAAGLLDDELFGEAVRSLAFRPEKKNVAAALSWIADRTTPSRAPAALHALATVFSEESPALRDRAARLATTLAHQALTPSTPGSPAAPRRKAAKGRAYAPATEQPQKPAVVTNGENFTGEVGAVEILSREARAAKNLVRDAGPFETLVGEVGDGGTLTRGAGDGLARKAQATENLAREAGDGRTLTRRAGDGLARKAQATENLMWDAGAAENLMRDGRATENLAGEVGDIENVAGGGALEVGEAFEVGEAVEVVREAAGGLPMRWRERLGAVIGPIPVREEMGPVPPAPVPGALAPLPPPITTPGEVAYELGAMSWQMELQRAERILAALVTLVHRDRDALAEALRPWRRTAAERQPYLLTGPQQDLQRLLARCALAVVAPGESQVPDDMVAQDVHWNYPHPLQRFLARRLNEVIELFESGGSVPVLLATPTEPTGHVDPVTLLERMESPGGAEPLEADFHQALLRLPRRLDPALAERADRLGSAPGRALAHWLRRGGLPDPDVTCQVRTRANQYGSASVEVDGRIAAPREIPPPIAELWTPFEGARYLSYPHTMAAWPAIMPSHPEVVAAHLARFLPQGFSRRDGVQAIVAALAHADGPAGDAVAAVVTFGLGHRQPERRGHAVDALVTLTIRGELPAAAVGRTVVQLLGADAVRLGALTEALQQATTAGAYTGVWGVLAEALPALLPAPGERPRAGLAGLLVVAAETAAYARTAGPLAPLAPVRGRPGIERLAEVAARRGGSRMAEEARRLLELVSG
ncbi:hypothetical protein AB0K05_20045 [Nonomuraea sp. NPDC049486]|uniref:DUF7824 domain-containing protein n=1 Tax=Nonomuraea sp. NPDC049486 TaxID=3155773 RepID=UPI00343A6D82